MLSLFYIISRKEVNMVRIKNVIIAFSLSLLFTLVLVATLVSTITMLYAGDVLTSANLFTLVTILGVVTYSVHLQMVGVRGVYDTVVSINRFEKYLLSEIEPETQHKTEGSSCKHNLIGKFYTLFTNRKKSAGPNKALKWKYTFLTNMQRTGFHISTDIQTFSEEIVLQPHVTISNMSCSWSNNMNQTTLHNISLVMRSSMLLIITGPVGSGKSTLLMTILQEIIIQEGKVTTQGQIAYVGQIPWIFTGTVRENILYGKPYDQERYQRVLESCDLWQDIQHFPKGDMSMLGQRGVLLSGGQRTRVGLARAAYSDSDIILLDDPLSAVDGKVGQHLFDKCICGELSGKIRILVTHQLQYHHRADEILVLKDGSIVSRGWSRSFGAELTQSDIPANTIFSDPNESLYGQQDSRMEFQAHDSRDEFRGADLKEEEEMKAGGTVSSRLYWVYLKAGSSTLTVVALFIFSLIVQGNTLN